MGVATFSVSELPLDVCPLPDVLKTNAPDKRATGRCQANSVWYRPLGT